MKEISNNKPGIYNSVYSGICKITGNTATVTVVFKAKNESKNDLQMTYRFSGYKCSECERTGCYNTTCEDNCLLIRKEYL